MKKIKMKMNVNISFDGILETDEDEWHVYVPELKGLHTCGKTIKEACANCKNAIKAYLESLIKHPS